jgi:lipopolysaccharide transport system permease protein
MQLEQEISTYPQAADKAAPRKMKVISPPSFSPSLLFNGLLELFWYRDLFYTLSIHRIKVRYKQSALGFSWAIVQPIALMLIYTIIFSIFTRIPTGGTPYNLFVLSAILPWTFFQTAISSSAAGLVSHTGLITKVYFPREILPLTYVVAALFDFLIAGVILGVMMAYYHVALTINVLYVIPILLIETMLAAGISLLLSSMQVKYRDIGIAMPLLLQLWMFGSPVVYSYSFVPHRFRWFYVLNPMTGIIENFRRVLIEGIGADLSLLGISAGIAVILLPVAYLYFKHREATMADII